MNINQFVTFKTLSLRPHWIQYIINEFIIIILTVILFILSQYGGAIWGRGHFTYYEYMIWPCGAMVLYLTCKFIYMFRMVYVITPEQIILLKGVLSYSTDYVELYRVVDYKQYRTFWQQVFGLKDVIIYSGDRNNPKVIMTGVRENVDVVSEIRMRVEFNKKRRGIYEFTNQS